MLGYELIRRAFLVGIFLALSLPLIGVPLVLRDFHQLMMLKSCIFISVAIGLLLGN